jgi:DeoR/GlpR family transcriptional regulator of sugar metabolism
VVTYAHSILEKLALRSDIELILLGGVYEARGHRYRGLLTEISMRALRIDRFFFSGAGFHPQHGIGEPNPEEARFKAAAVAHASWNCALLDHTKISRMSDHFFVKSSELDLLISNKANAKAFADLSTITP